MTLDEIAALLEKNSIKWVAERNHEPIGEGEQRIREIMPDCCQHAVELLG
jgi:hypothetical protein